MHTTKPNKGFTLVESLVSIAILLTLFTLAIPVFRNFGENTDIDEASEKVISALSEAQKKTIASEMQDVWGVFFDDSSSPNRIVLFYGNDYAGRDSSYDETYLLPGSVYFSSIAPADMNKVIFERISGAASSSAAIQVALIDKPSKYKNIHLDGSGRISQTSFAAPSDAARFKDARHIHFTYSREISTTSESLIVDFDGGTRTETISIANNISGGNIYKELEVDVGGETQNLIIQTLRLNNPDTLFCVLRDRRYNNVQLEINIDGDLAMPPNLLQISADGLSTATGSSLFVSGPEWQ